MRIRISRGVWKNEEFEIDEDQIDDNGGVIIIVATINIYLENDDYEISVEEKDEPLEEVELKGEVYDV